MAFVSHDLTYNGLLKTVEDIITFDSSSYNIELRAILTTNGRHTVVHIKNDSYDENGASPPEFEINTDHGLDSFDEQYPFIGDETFGDFIGEEDNGEGVNCDRPNFDGEGDIDGESTASDHSHSSGDYDDDIVGNFTTQTGSSIVPRLWSILVSVHYSFQTINHEFSTTNGRLYKCRILTSKKELN
ncbi:hypothetical protein Ddye_001571 [Dipteronia dyeriana]|uniref:Uncharacterized protein n=1 Tax=Dipteronia dyeriana TaxID=168575 RepID=A0AAE0CTL5_9ROSI|nr:hypothetical protein Ddye_001571 [Dipteronia dyeriana]